MKGIKTLLTGILAATMIMGSTLTVCAQQTITITRDASYADDKTNDTVQKYTWYRALKAKVNADGSVDPENIGYYVDKEQDRSAIEATGLFTISENSDGTWTVVLTDKKTTGEDIAAKLYEVKDKFTEKGTVTASSASTAFNVEDGYYLIVSELGSKLIADTAGRSVTIAEKNSYPTIDKQQKDATDNGNWLNKEQNHEEKVDVKVGDTIDYKLIVNVPYNTSNDKDIVITDTMSAGLELAGDADSIADSIVVTGATPKSKTVSTDNKSFVVKLGSTTGEQNGSYEVIITFSAKVTEEAINDSAKKNDVVLEYGNYHQTDFVPYEMKRTAAFKYDGALATKDADGNVTAVSDAGKLEGVEFTLKVNGNDLKVSKADGQKYYVPDTNGSSTVVTDANGYIIIRGLDVDGSKSYTLTETKALSGYNVVATPAQLNLVSEAVGDYYPDIETAELRKIENNKGTILPSTGGIGTTIFYIVGGLLIVAGVAYFIVRRKVNAE